MSDVFDFRDEYYTVVFFDRLSDAVLEVEHFGCCGFSFRVDDDEWL